MCQRLKQDEMRQIPMLYLSEDNVFDDPRDSCVNRLRERMKHVAAALLEAVQHGRGCEVQLLLEQVYQIHDLQQQIIQLPATPGTTAASVPTYVAGSLFLDECYRYLLQGEPEWMHAVTGVQIDSDYTLDRMVLVEPAVQSKVRVTAKPDSVFSAMEKLTKFGHALHAVFHSHRMHGVQQPSAIDWTLQERLKRGGYHTIQCIFSEDGYMTFFGDERPFAVQVFGKGVEKIDENVYRFVDWRSGRGNPAAAAAQSRSHGA